MNNDKKFKFFSRSASPAAPAAEQEEESRPRRRGFFKTLLPLLLVAAVLLSIFGGRKRGDSSGVEVITELRSAEAVTGSLEEVLLSGGFLSESESESLGFAGNVRLLSWEVGENEVVVKGQPLATVDRNSVLASISELKELADNATVMNSIAANAKGVNQTYVTAVTDSIGALRDASGVFASAEASHALTTAVENLYSNVSNLTLSDKDAEDFKYRYRNYESALLRISHDGYNDEAAAFNAEKSGFPAGLISAVRGIHDATLFN